jgi:hypothetical protein
MGQKKMKRIFKLKKYFHMSQCYSGEQCGPWASCCKYILYDHQFAGQKTEYTFDTECHTSRLSPRTRVRTGHESSNVYRQIYD